MASTPQAQPILTEADVREYARFLLSPARADVAILVSTASSDEAPYIDISRLFAELGNSVVVHTIVTGRLTYELDDLLPPDCGCFGGAVRIYPRGDSWHRNPRQSHLQLCHPGGDKEYALQRIIGEAKKARDAGPATYTSAPQPTGTLASGKVLGSIADMPIVALSNGKQAALEISNPPLGTVLTDIYRKGMSVSGILLDGSLRVTLSLKTGVSYLTDYAVGDVVLAKVNTVDTDTLEVLLVPVWPVTVTAEDLGLSANDDLTAIFSRGDVLELRITARGDRLSEWSLAIPDDETAPAKVAPALLPGGPPWLRPAEERTNDTADTPHAQGPVDDAAPAASLDGETETISALPATGIAPTSYTVDDDADDIDEGADTAPGAVHSDDLLSSAARLDAVLADLTYIKRAFELHTCAAAPETVYIEVPSEAPPLDNSEAEEQLHETRDLLRQAQADARDAKLELKRTRAALSSARLDHQRDLSELSHAEQELADASAARDRAKEAAEKLRHKVSELKAATKSRDDALKVPDDTVLFKDPAEQFRFEVYLSWVRRYTADDKTREPLPQTWYVGPDFINSITESSAPRGKVVDCATDILTGRTQSFGWRVLREDEGADSAPYTRSDGAVMMRANIESGTPGARRLHVWKRTDGTYEFHSVNMHDDYGFRT